MANAECLWYFVLWDGEIVADGSGSGWNLDAVTVYLAGFSDVTILFDFVVFVSENKKKISTY